MKQLRLLLAVGALVTAASVFAGTAAADPPTKTEFSVVGEQFVCGATTLTITAGTVSERRHVHKLRNALFRVIQKSVPKGVIATDEQGNVFRVVGSAHANFTTPNPEAEGGEVGFFRIKLNIVGRGGLFGTVDFRVRAKRNGEEIARDRGTCQFVEP